ncbi:MAG: phenylacetate--CoA ligase [Planctomycetota bacterium]|jgi:phenylacetate-CoA ligase|nr:phenylacetate--CoA ligase [Planctomycetota bacterium]
MSEEMWSDRNSPVHPVSAPDYLPLDQLRVMQLARLKAVVKRTYDKVAHFRQKCERQNVAPDSLQTLADLRLFPFTAKTDLRDTYPFGLFASEMSDITRLHASSGTTGKPIVVAYTRGDIGVWAEGVARALAAGGVRRGDVLHNAYGYGLFTGGLGLHYGAEKLGATVIPVSGGNTERQVMLLHDFGANAVSCTPSYFLHLIDAAGKMKIDLRQEPLRVGFFGAEPWTDAMRAHIEDAAGIHALDIYGLSEISGPGVAQMCLHKRGMHIWEDHFYPEIIDPDTLEVLPAGAEGELVITTLTKEAFPMIRYRTRDITSLLTEPCPCGRTMRRIARIGRRSDDMFIIRGVNVFPSQIESGLLSVEGVLPHYRIILRKGESGLDELLVEVEIPADEFTDRVRDIEQLRQRLAKAIENIINIRADVRLVEAHSLPRSEGKIKRLFDERQKS